MPFRFGIDKAGAGLSVTRYIEKSSEREAIVPDEVAVIGNDAFRGCGNIEKVTLPAAVKRIMSYAFADCLHLDDIALGGTEEIGRGAFSGCIRLRSIYLPDSVKAVRSEAFQGCSALRELRLPDTRPDDISGLSHCRSLSSISLCGSTFSFNAGSCSVTDTISFVYSCFEQEGYILRRFYGTEIDTGFLYGFVIELFACGNADAASFIKARWREMLRYGVENGHIGIVKLILGLYGSEAVTDELIDIAVGSGFHEIYLMLMAGRHGESAEAEEGRFLL